MHRFGGGASSQDAGREDVLMVQLVHSDMKLPPHNIEAEQAVLGAMMLSDDAYWTASGIVKAEDFYRSQHKLVFEAIAALASQDKPRDIVTLSEWMEKTETLEKAGGMIYVGQMVINVPYTAKANVKAYADIVAKSARARKAIQIMEEGCSELFNSLEPDAAISVIQSNLESSARGLGVQTTFMDVLRRGVDMITRNRERRLEGKLAGVSYSLKALDERTGGMRRAQLIAVAGRPSLGKTAFTHQSALSAAMAGIPVGSLSLEMSQEQLAIRSLANRFRVNGTALMFGHDTPIETVTHGLAADPGFRNIPLYVDTDTYDYHAIVSRIVEWKRKHDIQVVFIDHIGLVQLDSFDKKVDRLGYITNNLKRLAKRLDMPIVIVCQLNRSLEKDKRRPVVSDFRDCGEIEQDIDVGIFLHSEGDDEAQEIDVEIGLLKNRDGMRGWLPSSIRFLFRKHVQVFEQL